MRSSHAYQGGSKIKNFGISKCLIAQRLWLIICKKFFIFEIFLKRRLGGAQERQSFGKFRLLDFCEKSTVFYRIFNVDFENEMYLRLTFSVLEIQAKFALKMSKI